MQGPHWLNCISWAKGNKFGTRSLSLTDGKRKCLGFLLDIEDSCLTLHGAGASESANVTTSSAIRCLATLHKSWRLSSQAEDMDLHLKVDACEHLIGTIVPQLNTA
ncbi:hypothetical protein NL676_035995 [Syzygium grande]|nr:hypothetical protein NL676_035995 [Syzygium grande]